MQAWCFLFKKTIVCSALCNINSNFFVIINKIIYFINFKKIK